MGIDALDLSFRLEKTFGIKIGRDEAHFVFSDTLRTIHRHLTAKLRGRCQRVPAFVPLYIEIAQAVNRVPRSSKSGFLARVKGNSHFPDPEERTAAWKSLEKELGVQLPSVGDLIGERLFKIFAFSDARIPLTHWIAENHPERVKEWIPVSCERSGNSADQNWTEHEIWEALCDCIAEVLRVKREDITPDARLVEDLGMD
jgi:acyl carrier protein